MFLTARPCYNLNMDKVRIKAPAKVNFALGITGESGGFHMLDSIVCTIDLFDDVIVAKRSDGRVNITMRGMGSENIPPEANNAVRAAELFAEKHSTGGADITITKRIPMGAGLGGSSADAAGVLRAMSKLYGRGDEKTLGEIADMVGSDTRYMLRGGWARLRGRGNEVEPLKSQLKLSLLILCPPLGVSTAQCYKLYDELPAESPADCAAAALAAERGDLYAFCKNMRNALYAPAVQINPDVLAAVRDIEELEPVGACMTGSGSAVFGVFPAMAAARRALADYGKKFRAICAATYVPASK